MAPSSDEYDYDAFVSYRHVYPDRRWAVWLHRSLERFRTPRALVRRGVPRRLGRVFRDEDELAASSDLGKDIRLALQRSRFLIVVCSPRTPASKWIAEEVRVFGALHGFERILTLLIEGEPHEAFPTLISRAPESSDAVSKREPSAADVRPLAGDSSWKRRRLARLRILAPLLGRSFDDLRQREQERSLQRMTLLVAALAIVGIAIGVAAVAFLRQRDTARDLLANSLADRAQLELTNDAPERALPLLAESLRMNSTSVAGNYWLARSRERLPTRTVKLGLGKALTGINFDSARGRALLQDGDGTLRLARGFPDVPALSAPLAPRASADAAVWQPGGTSFAIVDDEGVVTVRNDEGGTILALDRQPGASIAFDATGRHLVRAGRNGLLERWELALRRIGAHGPGSAEDFTVLRVAPFGLVLGTASGVVEIRDVETLRLRRRFRAHQAEISAVALVAGRNAGVTVATNGEVALWDLAAGRLVARQKIGGHALRVAVDPAGGLLAASGVYDKSVSLWETKTLTKTAVLDDAHAGWVSQSIFSTDGQLIVTVAQDSTAFVWHAPSGKRLMRLGLHGGPLRGAAFVASGELLTFADDDRVRSWRLAPISLNRPIAPGQFATAAFSTDGALIASATAPGVVEVWHVSTGATVARLALSSTRVGVERLVFDAAGSLTALDEGGVLHRWDADGRAAGSATLGHYDIATELLAARDGLALVLTNGEVELWNLRTSTRVWHVPKTERSDEPVWATSAAWLPGEAGLLVGDSRGVLTLWSDMASPTPRWTLPVHTNPINEVAVSTDGSKVLTASDDRTVAVTTLPARSIVRFSEHRTRIEHVAIDGGRVLSGSDVQVYAWSIESGARIADLSVIARTLNTVGFLAGGARAVTETSVITPEGLRSRVLIWDVEKARLLEALHANLLAISPTGEWIAVDVGGVLRVHPTSQASGVDENVDTLLRCVTPWRVRDAQLTATAPPGC